MKVMVWRRKRGEITLGSTLLDFLQKATTLLVALLAIGVGVVFVTVAATPTRKCKVSEFACANGQQCVPSNKFCNNFNDCNDSSDEPRYCTKCNRTYYGDVDITYDLELHRPKEAKIPYICHLTFVANGGAFGDIVQLKFDSFTLGRFVSFTSEGCPDGALQISESNRPHMGGSWCGTSWGPSVYYSETKSVVVTVSLLKLSKSQSGYNFDFRMEYKFFKKSQASVRYGGISKTEKSSPSTIATTLVEPEYYLGELISGTYCSRIFSDCDRKRCRLQSPNFPGLYPRNVTCYYAVRQHEIPQGKHALIVVQQPKGQLVSIRSQAALYGTATTRELKVWNACDDVQDYVTIYDGYTTRDPVILKFCGGGEAVPKAVSSGHELLVEFSTSPYGTFLQPTPAQPLNGFQLEVEVQFVDQQSHSYIKSKRQCEFWIRGTSKGILENPIHSLPSNTSCLYHLQGMDTTISPSPVPFRPLSRYPEGIWTKTRVVFPPPRYRVWLTVIKFYDAGPKSTNTLDSEACKTSLKVWDGQLWNPTACKDLYCKEQVKSSQRSSSISKNVTLLGRYCREYMPKICDHVMLANETRFPRPCLLSESYLSTSDSMTLELNTVESTALRPVKFRVFYEFVDLHQDGEPYGSGPCSRKFTESQIPKFKSPKDIFLYGRGGLQNVSCIYRFEGKKEEKVKITLTKVIIKGRDCLTKINPNTDRFHCYGNNKSATLRFFEIPWNDVPPVPKDCVCSEYNASKSPITFISTSNVVELRFDATNMSAADDYTTLYFEGSWQFIRTPVCNENFKNIGANGEITFRHPNNKLNCENYPRVIIPSGRKYLLVKIHGVVLQEFGRNGNETELYPQKCMSANRIAVHTSLHTTIVCPYSTFSRYDVVQVFSEGWKKEKREGLLNGLSVDHIEIDFLGNELSRAIVVEFLGKQEGTYSVRWLELSRRREFPTNGLNLLWTKAEECLHRCPEINACVNSTVWCDGFDDCPSGVDEALTHCSFLFQLPPLYLFLTILTFFVVCGTSFYVAWKTCKRRRSRSFLQTRLRSLSSDTAIIDEKGIIC